MSRSTKIPSSPKVKSITNHETIELLSQKLSIKNVEDWYSVTNNQLVRAGGGRFLNTGNLSTLLKTSHPHYNWLPWRFNKVPVRFWETTDNKHLFLEWMYNELRLNNLDDWYSVHSKTIRDCGGSTLLRMYDNSPFNLLSSTYPQHKWFPWKFDKVPTRFWDNQSNQRDYFDWLTVELDIKSLDGWYSVTTAEIVKNYGSGLLWGKYHGSLFKALSTIYPEYNWLWWKFERSPSGMWKDKTCQKAFIEWVAKELSVRNMDDWYNVRKKDLVSVGATSFLKNQYNGSLYHALNTLYPEHNWIPWKFRNTPRLIFENEQGIRQWLAYASSVLCINHLADWYRVSVNQLIDIGGGPLLAKYNGLFPMLCELYPEYDWNPMKIQSHQKKSSQRYLHLVLSKLLPDCGVVY